MKWVWWLFVFPLAATVNEPLRVELFSGYRNDRLHWHLQDGGSGLLNYSEIYRDIEFWENGLSLKAIHRDLMFFLCGSYGAFGKGSLFQRNENLPFTQDSLRFRFDTNGWAADATGYFSYAVNLTADRTYQVLFLPLIGYSAHFEHLRRNNGRPRLLESSNAVGADAFAAHSSLPGSLHSTWYGFFVGAGFSIAPGGRLHFNGGYSYHWLNERFKAQFKNTVLLFDPDLINKQETSYWFQAKGNGNIGQTGWAQVDYSISSAWRAGLGARIHYFSTTLLPTTLRKEVISIMPSQGPVLSKISQKLKVRWTPISGWLMISREL